MRNDLWSDLSPCQRALIRELASGRSMKQAAHVLRISIRAAHFRWQAVRERLGCETAAHAIALLAGDALSLLDPVIDEVGVVITESIVGAPARATSTNP